VITKLTRLLLPALLVSSACSESQQEQSAMQSAANWAELALVNGGIYTVDAKRSWAEAAAVRGGEFVSIGSNA
jgi:hypothetical protein